MVFWYTASLRVRGSTAIIALQWWVMKWRPTIPERLARPRGAWSQAERSSSTAELTAPADSTTHRGFTDFGSPWCSTSRATISLPFGSVCSRVTLAPLQSRTLSQAMASCKGAFWASALALPVLG